MVTIQRWEGAVVDVQTDEDGEVVYIEMRDKTNPAFPDEEWECLRAKLPKDFPAVVGQRVAFEVRATNQYGPNLEHEGVWLYDQWPPEWLRW